MEAARIALLDETRRYTPKAPRVGLLDCRRCSRIPHNYCLGIIPEALEYVGGMAETERAHPVRELQPPAYLETERAMAGERQTERSIWSDLLNLLESTACVLSVFIGIVLLAAASGTEVSGTEVTVLSITLVALGPSHLALKHFLTFKDWHGRWRFLRRVFVVINALMLISLIPLFMLAAGVWLLSIVIAPFMLNGVLLIWALVEPLLRR
jgi:hypothetical protein